MNTSDRVPVWDFPVRLFHWVLLITVVASWFTRHGFGVVHEWLGYAAMLSVVLRVIWGFTGPPYARFGQFLRSLPDTMQYVRLVVRGTQPRYLGHNPLGGWMSLLLLLLVLAVCVTGWLYTTDRFWGVEWVESTHGVLTNVLIAAVVVHVLGVLFASRHDRENLPAAMLHGKKRAPTGRDID